jgi:hypothetical protein
MKDRYFLPSREHGNLIDVAVSIFDKHLFGSAGKKKIYTDSFSKTIKIVRMGSIR